MKKYISTKSVLLFSALLIFSTLFTSCFSSRNTVAVEEGWEIIGEEKVNFVHDNDVIEVRNRNQFTAIKFMIEEKDVRVNGLQIYFVNGDKLEPAIDDVILANQYSRVINLGAEGRYIDRIEFKYRTQGNILKGRGKLIVLGRKFSPYGF